MLSPKGYFYSAEDADSEGVEGKYYTWTVDELKNILSDEEFVLFTEQYNIKEEGNYEHEASRTKDGTNIPHLKDNQDNELNEIRKKLFEYRDKRIHPLRDDKMLTDWNSLMIASFSYAARIFNNRHYLAVAENAAEFIYSTMLKNDSSISHVYKGEVKNIKGKLDDYAFFIFALLELFNTTLNPDYLKPAVSINDYMLLHFYDTTKGFFLVSDLDEELITRPQNIYDSAIPAGSSVAVYNLLKLSKLTGNMEYLEISNKYFDSLFDSLEQNNTAFSFLLSAYLLSIAPSKEIIITDKTTEEGFKLSVELSQKYSPNLTTILLNEKNQELLADLTSYSDNYPIPENGTKYFLCKNYNCNLPEDNVEIILERI